MFEISTLHTAAIVAFFLGVFVGVWGMVGYLLLRNISPEWRPRRLLRAYRYYRIGYSWRLSWHLSGSYPNEP